MKRIVIALSGPPGSGASTIGKLLAKKLKIKYFSPGKYFKKLSRQKNETKAAMERLKTRSGRSKELHEYIDNIQLQKAKEGNVVLEGTLSIHFLKDLSDFKIWLDADVNTRAARTAKRDKLTIKEARLKVIEREKIEREMWKKIYGFDYFDQNKEADLVIDTSKLTISQILNRILSFIKNKTF